MSTATAPTITDGHLISSHPATGEQVGRYRVSDETAIKAAVTAARTASTWWSGLTHQERRRMLLACKAEMRRDIRELVQRIRVETGKSMSDAITEVSTCFEHVSWAAKNAARVLKRRRVRGSLSLIDHTSYLEYQPYGVVAVIGPWNYPLHTPMGSIIYALAAGNTVVFKPSEYTPGVGQWIVDLFQKVTGHSVVTIVHGLGDVGAILCEQNVDKIAFTGSVPTARKVATAAAKRLIPALIEGGGKDAVIVDYDADLDAAANYIAWGAFTNAGQSCTGFERVYVVDDVADEFIVRLIEEAFDARAGIDDSATVGPITMPKQFDIIEEHIRDAIERGAECPLGGREGIDRPFIQPTILIDVPEDAKVVTEETFGPVIVVNRVGDSEEALRLANTTLFGLGGAVFGKRHAMDLASRMRSGMTAINTGFAYAGVPSLPFGGVGQSGYGRAHGADGLREFATPKAIIRRRFPAPIPLMSLRRTPQHNKLIERWLKLR